MHLIYIKYYLCIRRGRNVLFTRCNRKLEHIGIGIGIGHKNMHKMAETKLWHLK